MRLRPAAALSWGSAKLRDAGAGSPQDEVRTLLAHVSGLSAIEMLGSVELDDQTMANFAELIERRCAGIPVQHLTGRAWFRGVELAVGPGVFIPRPETELVAGAVIEEVRGLDSALVVELCAGSGAITAAVADEVPGVRMVAVEREPQALEWLRRNLAPTTAEVVAADMADALPEMDGQAAVVVANPPYLAWSARDELPLDVRDHDPAAALFADEEGLAAIKVVARVAWRLLRPGGLVVIEHGDDQGAAVRAIATQAGFVDGQTHQDLAGRDRFVTARKNRGQSTAMSGWEGEPDDR